MFGTRIVSAPRFNSKGHMTSQPSQRPDLSIDPEVKAKRTRQNRIMIAIAVMVVIPIVAVSGTKSAAMNMMERWLSSPTFALNTEARVVLGSPGSYEVWVLDGPSAQCTVTRDGETVPSRDARNDPDYLQAGFYLIVAFTVTEAGAFTFFCESSNSFGHAMVTTASPLNNAAILLVIGWMVAAAAGLTGLVLLIVGVASNAGEKKRAQYASQPPSPMVQPGFGYYPQTPYPPGLPPQPPQAPPAPGSHGQPPYPYQGPYPPPGRY